VKQVPGNNNVADIFTKPLPKSSHEKYVYQLGIY